MYGSYYFTCCSIGLSFSYHRYSLLQLVLGRQPDIFHLYTFGCAVYVPISTPQRTKMGPQFHLEIYVRFNSPSIIRYLESLIDDLFTAWFADCHFDETIFPSIWEWKVHYEVRHELFKKISTISHLDHHMSECETEVQKMVHL